MFHTLARAIHVMSLGLWFGAMVMFNFIVAPTQFFEAFPAVVESAPSDRTAYVPITQGIANDDIKKKELATALAGSAVGPVFPKFFQLQAVCAVLALITALGWWKSPGKVNRCRVIVLALAAATVAVGWPISTKVSALRIDATARIAALAEAEGRVQRMAPGQLAAEHGDRGAGGSAGDGGGKMPDRPTSGETLTRESVSKRRCRLWPAQ